MVDSVVLDNTVFNYFVRIEQVDLSNLLRSILSGRPFVSSRVLQELYDFGRFDDNVKLEKLKSQIVNNNFFTFCTSFDSVVLEFASENIDSGEAESVAQCMKRRIKYFITDDQNCTPFIRKNYPDISVKSSFFLLALADLNGYLTDFKSVYFDFLGVLRVSDFSVGKKKSLLKKLVEEYDFAAKLYGIKTDVDVLEKKLDF